MAEEERDERTEGGAAAEGGGGASEKTSEKKKSKLSPLILAIVALVAGGGGGAGTAVFMAPATKTAEITEEEAELPASDTTSPLHDYVYHEFEPLTVNLNVPRQNRYIRATVVLAIRDQDKTTVLPVLEKRTVELTSWLMTYMANLTLEEVSGRKNIVRIQREIRDAMNEQLWPGRRPRIEQVLFKDFAVQ
jgi:flagellar basal body-associated protein FliL